MSEEQVAEKWACVEVMGHRRLYGRIREETVAGATMLRVDVPGRGQRCPECEGAGVVRASGFYGLGPTPTRPCKPCLGTGQRKDGVVEPEWIATQYYSGASLFCVTPCTEAAARIGAGQNRHSMPIEFDAPRLLPSSHNEDEGDNDLETED